MDINEIKNPLNQQQMIHLIQQIMNGELSDLELYKIDTVFSKNVSYPGVVSLIHDSDYKRTAKEIYEIISNYKVLVLNTRDELINLVENIMLAKGNEQEMAIWMDTLEHSVPHPAVSDLIYYQEKELTAPEIVDIALAFTPSFSFPLPSDLEQ